MVDPLSTAGNNAQPLKSSATSVARGDTFRLCGALKSVAMSVWMNLQTCMDAFIGVVQNSEHDVITLVVNKKPLKFKTDTGSDVSVIRH